MVSALCLFTACNNKSSDSKSSDTNHCYSITSSYGGFSTTQYVWTTPAAITLSVAAAKTALAEQGITQVDVTYALTDVNDKDACNAKNGNQYLLEQ